MPFLKTTCEFCGEIELPVARVLLRIDPVRNTKACVVRCPLCSHRFLKEANEAMVVMLLAVGIEVSVWSASLGEGYADEEAPVDRSPISHEELVEFRDKLGSDQDILRHLAAQ